MTPFWGVNILCKVDTKNRVSKLYNPAITLLGGFKQTASAFRYCDQICKNHPFGHTFLAANFAFKG